MTCLPRGLGAGVQRHAWIAFGSDPWHWPTNLMPEWVSLVILNKMEGVSRVFLMYWVEIGKGKGWVSGGMKERKMRWDGKRNLLLTCQIRRLKLLHSPSLLLGSLPSFDCSMVSLLLLLLQLPLCKMSDGDWWLKMGKKCWFRLLNECESVCVLYCWCIMYFFGLLFPPHFLQSRCRIICQIKRGMRPDRQLNVLTWIMVVRWTPNCIEIQLNLLFEKWWAGKISELMRLG